MISFDANEAPRVLCIGECMAELAPTSTPDTYRLGFAGDTFNTAWYLARTAPEVQVQYYTSVGDDALSGQMQNFMRDSGIDDRHVGVIPGKTVGLYQIHTHHGERSFTYWRDASAARSLARDTVALWSAMDAASVIYFSGITLAILDPQSRSLFLAALKKAKAAGKEIVFDPNLRPRLWPSGARMTDAIMEAAALSSIALPSFEDEAEWFGDDDPSATIQRYRAAGVPFVVVKNGDEPVEYRTQQEEGRVQVTPSAAMVDSTAAGDSFNAGLLAGLLKGLPVSASIEAGCALAGRVVQQTGALVDV